MSKITSQQIERRIYIIRECKVMIDSDLALLYKVETRILNRNVKRSINKFPHDFMFQLSQKEWHNLRSQSGISNYYGGRRYPPYVFTEYGIAALSGVLNSTIAIKVNTIIIKAFINMRQLTTSDKELSKKIEKLETDTKTIKEIFPLIFNQLQQLEKTIPSLSKDRKKIGFK